jgi:lipopolysaccharide transport protein LptA
MIKLCPRIAGARFICALALSITVGTLYGQIPMKGIKFAIPFDQTNGQPVQSQQIKTLLSGETVLLLPSGLYAVNTMRIENHQPDGKTNLIVRAPECLLDWEKRTASSPTNRLELESPNGLYIEGTGFFCYLSNINLTISNQVRTFVQEQMLKASPELGAIGSPTNSRPATNIAMTVFADHFELDYSSNVITYTGNVRLEHTQLRLLSDILTIRRGTNGALQRVVAEQHVVIFNKLDNSRASGDLAVYSPLPRETVELSGHAAWNDDQRQSRADLFVFETRDRHLRAQGNAWMSVPRQSVGQPEFWGSKPATNLTNLAASISATNAPVEISAELLDLQMPTTNQPNRLMIAEQNVLILSPSDKSRATATNRAVFDERTGMLELTGDASWQAGERIARGQVLRFDRTNRIFTSHLDAYLRVPIAELNSQLSPKSPASNPKQTRTNSLSGLQFAEVFSRDYTYTSNLLVFRDDIRANVLADQTTVGTMTCDFLGLRFSNQLDTAVASGKVNVEQFPNPIISSNRIARQLECEQLQVKMGPAGTVQRLDALLNVVGQQQEWRKGTNPPVRSRLSAKTFTADFFPRTNQVREAIAEQNVVIAQDERSARGDRAVFTGTNNTVELTGHPRADFPQGSVTNAEVLVWDRAQNKFFGKNLKGEAATTSTQTNAPAFPIRQKPAKKHE